MQEFSQSGKCPLRKEHRERGESLRLQVVILLYPGEKK
ncbi:hypothetical protein NIES2098_10600 [Calothrix sp. NIES-2098]|nr:hypothetical protein NIES2098_10600 [Calothrix sp. NIES-2098]